MGIDLRIIFELAHVEIKIKNIGYRESDCRIEAAFIVSADLCNTGCVGGTSAVLTVKPPRLKDCCLGLNAKAVVYLLRLECIQNWHCNQVDCLKEAQVMLWLVLIQSHLSAVLEVQCEG